MDATANDGIRGIVERYIPIVRILNLPGDNGQVLGEDAERWSVAFFLTNVLAANPGVEVNVTEVTALGGGVPVPNSGVHFKQTDYPALPNRPWYIFGGGVCTVIMIANRCNRD